MIRDNIFLFNILRCLSRRSSFFDALSSVVVFLFQILSLASSFSSLVRFALL